MKEFCKKHNITEDQFTGKEKIEGNLNLYSVTSLPEGFNPTVGGYLDLRSVTSLPEGFNPKVGGCLDLRSVTSLPEEFNPIVGGCLWLSSVTSLPKGFNPKVGGGLYLPVVTSLPEGFNPTVGGYLDLRSVTSLPEGFNPTVGGYLILRSVTSLPELFNPTIGEGLYLDSVYSNQYTMLPENYMFTWENGKYIKVDGIFVEVISKHLNVWKCKYINKDEVIYVVTDGTRYAHGSSIDEAREDLKYKISDRDSSSYNGLTVNSKLGFWEMVECYRVITGACKEGVKEFLKRKCVEEREYSIGEVVEVTKGEYRADVFKEFFTG
jgi:hypothetical protein